ncbi:hypothetical protein ABN028_19420 [Actinopolymorpha sp. B17G11]|uniref:hypothetical protein n=1 Tax=Actinopolymorpha sp. B17G11 TaxID=3160861 RepID=UPI0032E52125
MTDAAPTTPDAEQDRAMKALDSAMSEPSSSLNLVVQSAVDLPGGNPVVVIRWGGETVTIEPDVARGMAVQFATAAGRSESEAAFVRLLRDRGEESDDKVRDQLVDLFGSY